MHDKTLRANVRQIVGRMSPFGARDVSSEDRLVEDLGYDSLAVIELSLRIEKDFTLTLISDSEATADIKTVGDVEDFVAARASTPDAA
jgi:acyl carrier protein